MTTVLLDWGWLVALLPWSLEEMTANQAAKGHDNVLEYIVRY